MLDGTGIVKLFHSSFDDLSYRYQVVRVERTGDLSVDSLRDDLNTFCITSEWVYRLLLDRLVRLGISEAKQLFSIDYRFNPGSLGAAHLATLTFETIAILHLCGAAPEMDEVTRDLVRMAEVETKSSHCQFPYKHPKAAKTLYVSSRHLKLLEDDSDSESLPTTTATFTVLPRLKLTMCTYATLEDIVDIMDGLHVPEASKNTPFDAFFVESKAESTVVWIVQMTIGRDHDGAESGFAAVETIRDKVQGARPGLPVEFKYVLVVPFGKTWAVRWDMAAGFSEVQGEAFVQFIDLHMLHRYYPSHLVLW